MFKKATDATLPEKKLTSHKEKKKNTPIPLPTPVSLSQQCLPKKINKLKKKKRKKK